MRKLNAVSVLAVALAFGVLFLTNQGFKLTEEKEQILQKNQTLVSQISELDELKIELNREIDTLMNEYTQATEENDLLKKLLKNSKQKLAATTSNFQQFKLASTSAIQSLKESIQRLVKTKTSLETNIQKTNEANDVLLDQAGIDRTVFKQIMSSSDDPTVTFQQLENEFKVVKERREEAARARAARRVKVKSNQKPKEVDRKVLKATAFRTETEMKNGKLTAKAKRVKKVIVSFDLHDVPASDMREQAIYLVMKGANGKLLNKDAETVKVMIEGRKQEIRVVSTKKVILDKKQRVFFRFEVPDRLEEGYHKVEIYTAAGLLGKTSFRVEK